MAVCYLIPYFVQSAAYVGMLESPATVGAVFVQICAFVTCFDAMTCDSMVEAVTHSGVSKTDGTLFSDEIVASVSVVLPLTMPAGGFSCARREIANAAVACASMKDGLKTVPHW